MFGVMMLVVVYIEFTLIAIPQSPKSSSSSSILNHFGRRLKSGKNCIYVYYTGHQQCVVASKIFQLLAHTGERSYKGTNNLFPQRNGEANGVKIFTPKLVAQWSLRMREELSSEV